MKKTVSISLIVIATAGVACRDTAAPASGLAVSMASAFSVTPAGFDRLTTTFNASSSVGAFQPSFDGHGRGPGGFGMAGSGPGFGIGFMGGGLGGPFLGDALRPMDSDDNCSYSSTTGLVTCSETERNGLTVNRVLKFTTASGQTESAIDNTTNTASATVTVSGTATERDGDQSVVNESSNETITGLATGSTQRTVDGGSVGTETTTGTSKQGAFTAKRVVGDTIKGVVIPLSSSSTTKTYPTAGTIIRAMNATVTITGQSPANSSRREVITYDGSNTAKVVITQDGKTQNCTLPLPRGRLTCS